MRTYRPKSWSAQARIMADNQIRQTLESGNPVYSLRFFSNSYRADIIRLRAAKRFGRAMRKHGIDITKFEIITEGEKELRDAGLSL